METSEYQTILKKVLDTIDEQINTLEALREIIHLVVGENDKYENK